MNTALEEIMSFKCCAARAFDQNLEIQIKNNGSAPVLVPSYFDLLEDSGPSRVETLMPHGTHSINPGEVIALYCCMDEDRWYAARGIVLYDTQGNEYPVDIKDRMEG